MKIWNNDKMMVAQAIGCSGCELNYIRTIITTMAGAGEMFIDNKPNIYYYGRVKINNPTKKQDEEIATITMNAVQLTFRDKMNDNCLFDSIKNETEFQIGLQFTGIKIVKK